VELLLLLLLLLYANAAAGLTATPRFKPTTPTLQQ
jgi:hypothetical protein